MSKYLDSNGLSKVWSLIKDRFVQKDGTKGLSQNDFTDALKTKLDNIEENATVDQPAFSKINITTPDGTTTLATEDPDSTFTINAGDNITITSDSTTNSFTINGSKPGESYQIATPTQNGLMSSTDKAKLDTIAENAEVNKIDKITVNGAEVTLTDKTAAITVITETDVDNKINSKVTNVYKYIGSVTDATDLPTSDIVTGSVYNIVNKSEYGPKGTNVAWDGEAWDSLGGSFEVEALTDTEIQTIYDAVFNA